MLSWNKSLNRKTFALFDIPVEIKRLGVFEDGNEYLFEISAGNYEVKQVLQVTSGLEVSLPKDIQRALIEASEKSSYAFFRWNSASMIASDFDIEVEKSLSDSSSERRKRLRVAKRKPEKRTTSVSVFVRNPDVVAEVLVRAAGKCESCKQDAPFLRKRDGLPYLEVHHVKRLADGGDDTVSNAEALCPNCHRRKHFG